jgi:hypothetical protein
VFGKVLVASPALRGQMYLQSKCSIRFEDGRGPKPYNLSWEGVQPKSLDLEVTWEYPFLSRNTRYVTPFTLCLVKCFVGSAQPFKTGFSGSILGQPKGNGDMNLQGKGCLIYRLT